MLDAILQTDSLGDRRQIEYILEVAERGPTSIPILMEACYARSYGYRRSFRSLVKLLAQLGYLVIEGDRVDLGNVSLPEQGDEFVKSFCLRLFLTLTESGDMHQLFNSHTLAIDGTEEIIHFRNNRVALRYAPLRNLLIEIGLMVRDRYLHNVFVIAEAHYRWFTEGLPDWVGDSFTAGTMTLEQLKKQLQNQEEAGRAAEEFVVETERRRLAGHPRVDRVRMISDLDISAGYDIQSFASPISLVIDRYIEVKSYSGTPSFYWSSGEIEAAVKRGKSYFLCLVDRDQIASPNYVPVFIQDPANRMFSTDSWKHFCQGYYFERD